MTRKLLTNAETVSNWTSIAGALQGILHFLGDDADQAYVMGTTGHAFGISVDAGGQAVAAGELERELDLRAAIPLYEGLGVAWDPMTMSANEPGYGGRRKQVLGRIRKSIDSGRPVAAFGLHLQEWGIIKGYDDRADLLFVSTALSSQYGESLPLSQWPPPGRFAKVAVLLSGDRGRVDRPAVQRAVLTFAIDYALQPPRAPPGYARGLAAYDSWLRGYGTPDRLDPIGNARLIQTVQSARRDAARYLRAIAADQPGPAAALLEKAAANYEAEALSLSRLATLFPYPGGGDTSSSGALAAGAASLRQAQAAEKAAIELIGQALSQL